MDANSLARSYVLKNGEISKVGTIRILKFGVKPRNDPDEGLQLYSDKFLDNNQKGNTAEVVHQSVVIRDRKGFLLSIAHYDEIVVVDDVFSGKYRVMAEGWLEPARSLWHRLGYNFKSARMLRKVARSREQIRVDKSPFYKVDPSLKGRTVILLRNGSDETFFRIIDGRGKLIKGELKRPFWDPAYIPQVDDLFEDDFDDAGMM